MVDRQTGVPEAIGNFNLEWHWPAAQTVSFVLTGTVGSSSLLPVFVRWTNGTEQAAYNTYWNGN
jgi:hypothetical protein